jgi:hypothetical protein
MADFTSYPRQDVFETTITTDIGAGDISIALNDAPDFTMTTGGANSFYVVLDPDLPTTKIEIVKCDGITGNTLNVLTRGMPKYEGGASTANSHSAGAKVYISDNWQTFKDIYTAIASKFNAAGGSFTGPVDFSGATATVRLPNLTLAERNALTPLNGMKIFNTTSGTEQVYKSGSWYDNDTGTSPNNASETVAGIVELATDAEITAGTTTGATGARLVSPNDTLKTNLNARFPSKADVQNSNYIYAATATGNDTYVVTLTPAPAAYVDGMEINFKADVLNTGACTLNVNGLGAKAIKVNYNADPLDGAILANQINKVTYDGTNFQLISRESNVYDVITFTRDISAVDATIAYNHSLGKIPKRINFHMLFANDPETCSHGVWVPGKNYCVFAINASSSSTDTTHVINYASTMQGAVSAVTSSDFSIAWTKTGTPGSFLMHIIAELIA